ncbi:MAG TPA: S8/S53 family peptidase [Pseudonocardia sp.]|nr:S8/S53 family peptidase [Pseudonocardia sp.]
MSTISAVQGVHRPDPARSREHGEEERRRAEERMTSWERVRTEPAHRRGTLEILRERRAARRDLVQFDDVDNDGADTLVVAGRFLARAEDLAGGRARRAIADMGLVATRVGGLGEARGRGGALVQLDVRRLGDVAGRGGSRALHLALLGEGLPVRPAYVTPLGMIRKADGGPEISRRGWQRPAGGTVRGPRVAVIDTGVSGEQRADGWLDGLARPDNLDLLNVLPDVDDPYLDLGAGHGTFVTGVLQQVAPDADVRVYQALDTDGLAAETTVAGAIVAAVADGADILNLSFGTDALEQEGPFSLREAIEDAIAINPNVLMVCAAGNCGDTRPVWPAAFAAEFSQVVSVAALKPDGQGGAAPAEWSSHGDTVTCSTFGQGVVSTYVVGEESPLLDRDPDTFGENSWATWSGTSFAAPQVAGVVVRAMQDDNGLTPRRAFDDHVMAVATDIGGGYGHAVEILAV